MNEQKQTEWKLVPVEPTAEMTRIGGHANSEYLNDRAPIGEARYAFPIACIWREMLAAAPAAPHAPSWSSCTEPGPDGYQRTVQVPGMPGAARDAALEEMAAVCREWAKDTTGPYRDACHDLASVMLTSKSIAAPAPVQQATPSVNQELLALLIESQSSIGGDWRERRDKAVAAAPAQPAGLSEQDKLDAAAPDPLAACRAAIAYDEAIAACANDPEAMSSFCTANGDDLDTLYARWISLARAAIAKAAP